MTQFSEKSALFGYCCKWNGLIHNKKCDAFYCVWHPWPRSPVSPVIPDTWRGCSLSCDYLGFLTLLQATLLCSPHGGLQDCIGNIFFLSVVLSSLHTYRSLKHFYAWSFLGKNTSGSLINICVGIPHNFLNCRILSQSGIWKLSYKCYFVSKWRNIGTYTYLIIQWFY